MRAPRVHFGIKVWSHKDDPETEMTHEIMLSYVICVSGLSLCYQTLTHKMNPWWSATVAGFRGSLLKGNRSSQTAFNGIPMFCLIHLEIIDFTLLKCHSLAELSDKNLLDRETKQNTRFLIFRKQNVLHITRSVSIIMAEMAVFFTWLATSNEGDANGIQIPWFVENICAVVSDSHILNKASIYQFIHQQRCGWWFEPRDQNDVLPTPTLRVII